MEPNRLVVPPKEEERMLRWLAVGHLPLQLQPIVRHYRQLADYIVSNIPSGPERTVALRKLVESKDCAVRAIIEGMPDGT